MINLDSSNSTEQLLKAILLTLGRSAFGEDEVLDVIGKSEKNRLAYQLCDGSMTQADIVKAVKLDKSNFRKSVAKWVEAGLLFRLNDGAAEKLLHVRPLTKAGLKK